MRCCFIILKRRKAQKKGERLVRLTFPGHLIRPPIYDAHRTFPQQDFACRTLEAWSYFQRPIWEDTIEGHVGAPCEMLAAPYFDATIATDSRVAASTPEVYNEAAEGFQMRRQLISLTGGHRYLF